MNVKKVKGIHAFLLVGFATLLAWFIGLIIKPETQFTLFFGSCNNFFADLTNLLVYIKDLDPYRNATNGAAEHCYLPLSYVIMYLFVIPFKDKIPFETTMWKDPKVMMLIIAFTLAVTMSVFIQLYHMCQSTETNKTLLAFLLVFSGVYLFSIERGNLIILALSCSIYYLNHYNDENKRKRELAFILLAIAAAMKIFPAVLGLLVVFNGKWKEAFRLIVYGILFAFLPFLFFKGGFSNIPVYLENIKEHNEKYQFDMGCNFVSLFRGKFHSPPITLTVSIASAIMAFIILLAVPFYKNNWEKIAAVSIAMLVLPPHSGKYNAIFMLPIIVLFLNEAKPDLINVGVFLAFLMLQKQIQITSYESYFVTLVFMALEFGFFVKAVIAIKPKELVPTYKAVFTNFFKKESSHG